MSNNNSNLIQTVAIIIVTIFCAAAWLTHDIVTWREGDYGWMFAGAIFVPLGIINGVLIWFG